MDIVLCFFLLIGSPLFILFQRHPAGFFPNIFAVLAGKKSWVGYSSMEGIQNTLPRIRQGVLNPIDGLQQHSLDGPTISRLNTLYAKDYRAYADLRIVWKGWRNLGRSQVPNAH